MRIPFLLTVVQSKNVNTFPFSGLNLIKDKFRLSNTTFESNKTKFINELKIVSNHYGFKYVSSEIVYDGNIPENVFKISPNTSLDSDDEDYYYDEIIHHMEQFSKSNNMDDLFKDSYIILE